MEDKLWEIDTDKNYTGNYVFNSVDRLYCANGSIPDGTRESKIQERITKDRIERLPERIQDLIDDVALISHSDIDFISNTRWKALSKAVLHIEPRSKAISQPRVDPVPYYDGSSIEKEFGAELGYLFRVLTHGDDINKEELIFGFLVGLSGMSTKSPNDDYEILNEAVAFLTERIEERKEKMDALKEHNEQNAKAKRSALERLNQELQKTDTGILPENFTFLADPLARKDGPLPVLEAHFHIPEFYELNNLRWKIESDMRFITQFNKHGTEAETVLKKLWEKRPEAVTQISRYFKSNNNMPKAVLNRLSHETAGPEDVHHKTDTLYEIVQNSGNGWELTSYGKLVCYSLFSKDRSTLWLYNHVKRGSELSVELRRLIQDSLEKTLSEE